MQTFLPYSDFQKTAQVLDRQRLGKQRIECLQILRALTDPHYGWQKHPVVQMWQGYGFFLALYGEHICDEWIARGYKDTCKSKILDAFIAYQHKDKRPLRITLHPPCWLGDKRLHAAHRALLLFKDFDYYSQFAWQETPFPHCYWPLKKGTL